MARLSRKQIIAIILKKKGLLSGLLGAPHPPALGIHQMLPEAKQQRFLRAIMKSAPVKSIVPNPQRGISESWVVKLEGGQKAIFKEEFAGRELMAYQVDRIMGFNQVPAVVTRSLSPPGSAERTGILMQWSKGSKMADQIQNLSDPILQKNFQEMRVFDYIIGNEDRHGGNWLVRGTQVIPIDHGLSLTKQLPGQLLVDSGVVDDLYKLPLESRKALLPKIDRLLRREKYLKSLSVREAAVLEGAEDVQDVENMLERARFLKSYIKTHRLDTAHYSV